MKDRTSKHHQPRHETENEDAGFEQVSLPLRRLIEKVSARRRERLNGAEVDDDQL